MPVFKPTTWRLTDSGGGELTVGLSKLLFAGGTGGAFFVQEDSAAGPVTLPFAAAEFGGGLAVSAGGPVAVALTVPGMPSVGSGRVFFNPLRSFGSFGLNDIKGMYVALTLTGGVGFAGNGAIVFLNTSSTVASLLVASGLGISAALPACLLLSKGVAKVAGTSATSSAGASLTLATGAIF